MSEEDTTPGAAALVGEHQDSVRKRKKNLQTELAEAESYWSDSEPKLKHLELQISQIKDDRKMINNEMKGRDKEISKYFQDPFKGIRTMIEAQIVTAQQTNLAAIRDAIKINQQISLIKLREGFEALAV